MSATENANRLPADGGGAVVIPLRFKIGDTIRQRAAGRSYTYTLTTTEPFVCRSGRETTLLTWEGCCVICGAPFTTTTGRRPPRWMARTCLADRGTPRDYWPAAEAGQ